MKTVRIRLKVALASVADGVVQSWEIGWEGPWDEQDALRMERRGYCEVLRPAK